MNQDSPIVKAGSRICQAMTQANCSRDNRTGSRLILRASGGVKPTLARCLAVRNQDRLLVGLGQRQIAAPRAKGDRAAVGGTPNVKRSQSEMREERHHRAPISN